MAAWDLTTARASLRTLLADNDGDKFEFKLPLYPIPDGETLEFSLGRTKVVDGSIRLYLDGERLEDDEIEDIDYTNGLITLFDAPAASGNFLGSFQYQWFNDAQLEEFLLAGVGMLGFEAPSGVTPVNLRPVSLDFAAYHAYMHQAALEAEQIDVSAGGYTASQSRSHPNWRELARLAFEKAQTKLKLYLESPLGQAAPAMAWTTFRLGRYQSP